MKLIFGSDYCRALDGAAFPQIQALLASLYVACVNRPCTCPISHLFLIRMALADSFKLTPLLTHK